MKALIGREDLHNRIMKEYEYLRNLTSPEASTLSWEHHCRNIHLLAFKVFLNQDVYDF